MRKIATSFPLVIALSSVLGCSSADDPSDPPAAPETPRRPDPAQGSPASPVTSGDPMAPAPRPGPGQAMVRVVHASPDAPAVDVYLAGSDQPVVTGLAYGQTSGWLELAPGTYTFELRAAGAKPTDPIVHRTAPLAIPERANVSAIAAGLVGSSDADAAFRVLGLVENFDGVPAGSARVRALHAGSDAPSVDLDLGNDAPAAPEVTGLARFGDTGAAGIVVPAGEPVALGVDSGGSRVTAFTTPKIPAGAQLLVIATGLLGKLPREQGGFALLGIGPSGSLGFIGQDPLVYALHASPDAPRVDAFVGAAEIVDDLAFGQLARPIQVQPGSYTVDFYVHTAGNLRPSGAAAATSTTGMLERGQRYLATATGFVAAAHGSPTAFRLATFREGFAIDDTKAALRAVHGAPDAPHVDIGLATATTIDPVLFPDLAFSSASPEPGVAAEPGHLPVGVTPAGKTSTLVARFTVPAIAAPRAFAVAAGELSPKPGQPSFRLLVVDTKPSPWTVASVFPH